MTTAMNQRNRELDALFGKPSLGYAFQPMSTSSFRASLWIGDPTAGGVEVTGAAYAPFGVPGAANPAVYPAAVNGANKTFVGPVEALIWGPAESNWGVVTHWALSMPGFAGTMLWSFALASSYSMSVGTILALSMPSIVLDNDVPTMLGPTNELRRRVLTASFGNPGLSPFATSLWRVRLYAGDPFAGGVEPNAVDNPDYQPVLFANGSGQFSWATATGYEIQNDAVMTWVMCESFWGNLDHWAFQSVSNAQMYHGGELLDPLGDPMVINAQPGTRIRIPIGDWLGHFGEPI